MLSVESKNQVVQSMNAVREKLYAAFPGLASNSNATLLLALSIFSLVLILAAFGWLISQRSLAKSVQDNLTDFSFQLDRAKHRVQNYERILQRHYALATKPIISELSAIRRIIGCLEERLIEIDNTLLMKGSSGIHQAAKMFTLPLDINGGKSAIFEVVVEKHFPKEIGELYLDSIADALNKRFESLDDLLRSTWADYEELAFAS